MTGSVADPTRPRLWAGRLRGARGRLVAVSVLLLVVGLAVSILSTRLILQARTDERILREAARASEELAALAVGDDPATGEPFGTDVGRVFRVFLQRNVPSQHEVFLTYVDGQPFLRSGGQPPVRLDQRTALTERWGAVRTIEEGRVRLPDAGTIIYRATPVRVQDETVGVFVSAWFRDLEVAEDDQVVLAAAILGGLLLVASAAAVWQVTGRVLRPVAEVAATARSITETDLSRRITSWQGTDEIGRLVSTVNAMLDRIEGAFLAQRQFADDAGHELRTPITIIRGNLDLLDHGDVAQRRATLALVDDELDRMQRMVEDLLLLAKAQQPAFVRLVPLDLDDLTRDVAARARTLGDRDWQLDEVGTGVVTGDRDRLVQAVLQLVHNAVQHTEVGSVITIGSAWRSGAAHLWVSDTGPGVAPADAARIFDRFSRGASAGRDGDGHEGAGLGLSIVDAIVRAHGGHVELSSPPGGGACFTIVIPHDVIPRDRAGDPPAEGR